MIEIGDSLSLFKVVSIFISYYFTLIGISFMIYYLNVKIDVRKAKLQKICLFGFIITGNIYYLGHLPFLLITMLSLFFTGMLILLLIDTLKNPAVGLRSGTTEKLKVEEVKDERQTCHAQRHQSTTSL